MPSIRPLKRKIPSLSLFWEKECSWQELLPSSSTINVQRHAHIMLQIFLVERIPAYEFSADLVTRLCCPTTLRFFRQNSVNAGSTVAPLGAEENLLAEFRKGSSLLLQWPVGLWWRDKCSPIHPFSETFLCVSPAGGAQQDCPLPEEAGTRQRCCLLYTSAPFWWWISVLWNSMSNFFLSLVVPLSLVSGDGEPFDIELYPPGLEAAHQLLSKEELQHMFGVDHPHMVEHSRWK